MKCSEHWLREWVDPTITRDALCQLLTMSGLEVEEASPVAPPFTNVVVGQVLSVEKHPQADKLNCCQVTIGQATPLTIVCGAENVRPGLHVPVATVGAVLPNNLTIKATTIRGMPSEGMLCSAAELGLSEESQGLLELAADAPLGTNLRKYLNLDDYVIDIAITPNRGDCLSMRGVAREVSALTQAPLKNPAPVSTITPHHQQTLPVNISAKKACPRYIGRVIQNVKADLPTPLWLKERLQRLGVRSISPIVDVTNYVMFELGQPMHAFDLQKINGEIQVRLSQAGETIALLDGSQKTLDADTLVIADKTAPLAIAGVMGGLDSSVTSLTQSIFLESAFFMPEVVARQRQYYQLNSESSYRFERGVDFTIQQEAIERATQLILEITGGQAGPLIDVTHKEALPPARTVALTQAKIPQVLGVAIPNAEVERILQALQLPFTQHQDGWQISVPPYRFDIARYEDIIEEIARVYGYNQIPMRPLQAHLQSHAKADEAQDDYLVRHCFSQQGYHDTISYSFVDASLQALLDPEAQAYALVNPITSDMSVMRTNLWSGLVNTLRYNLSRQQQRVRLFEIGMCFVTRAGQLTQQPRLGGLVTGSAQPEQWGQKTREADFFDIKGDLESIFNILGCEATFKPGAHPALHPGQTATIYQDDQAVGVLGALHPQLLQQLDLPNKVWVFEFDLGMLYHATARKYQELSKFPEIRRDLAILIDQTIPADEIQCTIKLCAGDLLKEVFIFDVYQGKGISPGLKSVALALVLQHPTRTLVEDEVTRLIEKVVETLNGTLGAVLRS